MKKNTQHLKLSISYGSLRFFCFLLLSLLSFSKGWSQYLGTFMGCHNNEDHHQISFQVVEKNLKKETPAPTMKIAISDLMEMENIPLKNVFALLDAQSDLFLTVDQRKGNGEGVLLHLRAEFQSKFKKNLTFIQEKYSDSGVQLQGKKITFTYANKKLIRVYVHHQERYKIFKIPAPIMKTEVNKKLKDIKPVVFGVEVFSKKKVPSKVLSYKDFRNLIPQS